MKSKIYPCLWFDGQAREAADFYCSVFKNAIIISDNQMVVILEMAGAKFMFLNGGPEFKINPSISFFVICNTEKEIDETWAKLTDGGTVLMALGNYPFSKKYGWVQDRFGLNWQLSFSDPALAMQKFTPLLMFTGDQFGKAEEAINFYTSLFEDSAIVMVSRYTKNDQDVEGKLNHSQFRLYNQLFMAMESSLMHKFSFNEATSLVVECDSQKEIDFYWSKFTKEGQEGQCGWLKDKYGVSWQIVPAILGDLLNDPAKSERVMNAFLKMKKFEIDKLINA